MPCLLLPLRFFAFSTFAAERIENCRTEQNGKIEVFRHRSGTLTWLSARTVRRGGTRTKRGMSLRATAFCGGTLRKMTSCFASPRNGKNVAGARLRYGATECGTRNLIYEKPPLPQSVALRRRSNDRVGRYASEPSCKICKGLSFLGGGGVCIYIYIRVEI